MADLEDEIIEFASAGRLDALRAQLDERPDLARLTGPGGETLLHIVARQWPKLPNGADIARALIAAGADVNARDESGLRALQGATGDIELTRVLLDAGAETAVYAESHMYMSPAEVCLYYARTDEARLLAAHGAPIDLRVAAGLGDLERMNAYLGADGRVATAAIGLPGQPGPSLSLAQGLSQALSYAARNGQLDGVAWLLDHGAEINALVPRFDVGCTPLHQAVAGGHIEVAKLLLQRGAQPDLRDDGHNSTPKQWAEQQEKPEFVTLIAEHGG